MKCNEPHPSTSIKYARVHERSINQQRFTRGATCTFISLPLALSLSFWSLEMASGRKRPRSGLDTDSATSTNKHKVGYSISWKEDFPWHIPVYDRAGSTVTGLLCFLCKQHNTKQRNSVGTQTHKPCNLLRRYIIQCHKDSKMNKEAEELALAAAHASDSVPYLKQFKSILQNLFLLLSK